MDEDAPKKKRGRPKTVKQEEEVTQNSTIVDINEGTGVVLRYF